MTDVSRPLGPMAGAWDQQYDGACRNPDTELFLHPEGEHGSMRCRRVVDVKVICANCSVVDQCREYALAAQEPCGIWGSMTEEERCEEIRSKTRRVS